MEAFMGAWYYDLCYYYKQASKILVGEEFLHMKINNKDVYLDYRATADIPEDACSLRQYVKFACTELK